MSPRPPKIFLTGRPGIGKTTVLLKAVEELRRMGVSVGGMVSREVREGGVRIGFELLDLSSGEKGWLARKDFKRGPSLGKYRVNLNDIRRVGVEAIKRAMREADVIAVDEIGPMELFSREFKEVISKVLRSDKPVIGTIHYRARDPLIGRLRADPNVCIISVDLRNRRVLHEHVVFEVMKFIRGRRRGPLSS